MTLTNLYLKKYAGAYTAQDNMAKADNMINTYFTHDHKGTPGQKIYRTEVEKPIASRSENDTIYANNTAR
jgi:hypothetical protein